MRDPKGYRHKKYINSLPATTKKRIDEAVEEYLEHGDYVVASTAHGAYMIDDIDLEELFEALGLK